MTRPSPVAVTGANGRLGRAVLDVLHAQGVEALAWTGPEYDLDDPSAAEAPVARERPAMVIHCAAWTDVDACARDPDLALRRNAAATGELAAACAARGTALVYVSTNEVFDGDRGLKRWWSTSMAAVRHAYDLGCRGQRHGLAVIQPRGGT